ncbi:hypothetical protein LH447_11210 [Laribacter hongkongensis]|uniref:hypothetical protein n=1 Tax=Laribacter hongkongensis TaxID=168471 RepID=UPI001EFC6EB5|nr:hypothetical protein [Laribacter hongkongensis]MCG9053655.1 hypothetical protein [Laribacter hongkongensis]
MLSKKQYLRLTLVLTAPLLIFGWFLAESRTIFSIHNIIYCHEYDVNVTCQERAATQAEKSEEYFRDGAIRFHGAIFANRFSHPVFDIDKEMSPPSQENLFQHVEPSSKKILRLPPTKDKYSEASSCDLIMPFKYINPSAKNEDSWSYSCIGSVSRDGKFYFESKKTESKFLAASMLIDKKRAAAQKITTIKYIIIIFIPYFTYFILSAIFLCLIRIKKFIIHGNA